ncbi:MAG TPA: hypothetical protein VK908_06530 [Jiangellales bacterium]|nr:hypothetical protein [Jiangellales bacterium]
MSAKHLPHPAAAIGSSMVAGLARHAERGTPAAPRPADPRQHAWYIVFAWLGAHLHLSWHGARHA